MACLRTVLIALVLLVASAPAARAATASGEPVIAVIDSGINAQHREFAPDQVVAWWDFTKSEPARGQAWDPAADPFDDHGHGTGTAALAAARNVSSEQTPSACPGCPLAIARVADANGSIAGDVALAVRWAVDTAGADVINISIGSIVPLPGAPILVDEYDAFEYARSKGVLVVVANGNGTGNLGLVPGDGASSFYSSSRHVLAVGAAGVTGAHVSYQPEVSARYSVRVPVKDKPDGYRNTGGTSFSSPFVAGFAARTASAARAAGRPLRADALERLVKYVALDTVMPPVHEGYGVVDLLRLPEALAHAGAGTVPARPSPDASGLWVERVAGAERDLNAGAMPGSDPEPRPAPEPEPAQPEDDGEPQPEDDGEPQPAPPRPEGEPAPAPPPHAPGTAPTPPAAGTDGPLLGRVRLNLRRGRAHLSLTLARSARVRVVLRRGSRPVVRLTRAFPAGRTRLALTGRRLGRGRYVLRLVATDGGGASDRASRSLRVR